MALNTHTMVALSDSGGSGREPAKELVYDPKTGEWVLQSFTNKSGSSTSPYPSPSKPSDSNTGPSSGSSSSNVDSQKDAEKEYIETEFNVLSGELKIVPNEKTIRIKVNDTVRVTGLGKYLSGLYFVSGITRNISKDSGYSQSIYLIKNGFGDSVKKAQNEEKPETEETARTPEVEKSSPELKSGDSVKIVGDDAVYSNAHDGVKVPAWVKKQTLSVGQVSSDKTRVLLQPINSWTYIKYVQKV